MISLHQSYSKIERANKHIKDINREVITYLRNDPYAVIMDVKSEPGYQLLRIVKRHEQPGHWPLIIGDAIHNLRAALDILACDVMRYHNRGIASVHFPFAKDAEDLERVMLDRTVHRAREDVVNLFRALKPYTGGDDMLCAIKDFDNRDKHRLIQPVAYLPGITGMMVYNLDGSVRMNAAAATFLIGGDCTIPFRIENGMKVKYDRKAPVEIRFGEGPFNDKPVIPSLLQMSQLVLKIVGAFEKCINHPRPTILLGYTA